MFSRSNEKITIILSKLTKFDSNVKFNFIVSFIAYFAINCISYFMYPLFIWEHWGNTVPFAVGQVFGPPPPGVPPSRFGGVMILVILPFAATAIVGMKLKQLETPKLSYWSISWGFILGFMMLMIASITTIQNEVIAFITKIPTGWIRFLYFEGSLWREVIWNLFLTAMPFCFMCFGLREVQRKKETEAPAKKDDESVMESQKHEAVMNSSVKK